MRHSSDAIIINFEQIHCNDGALVLPTKFWEVVSRDFLENSFSEKLEKKQQNKTKNNQKHQNSISIFVEIIGCTSENLLIKGSGKIVFQEF